LVGEIGNAESARCLDARSAVTTDFLDKLNIIVHVTLEGIEWWAWLDLSAHDVLVDPPLKHGEALVPHVSACWYGKDVVELLQRPLLGFRHPEEDHNESCHVESRIKAERAFRMLDS
jgi:hypothetical protein